MRHPTKMAIASAFVTFALCPLPFALLSTQQQARDLPAPATTGTAVIAGVVVTDDAAAKPLRLARVTLNSSDRAIGQTATTDDRGYFAFKNLPAGRYTIQATKAAWLTTNYGATRPGRTGTAIAVSDGQQFTTITMKMSKGAVITGVVRDQAGTPAAGVAVSVLQYAQPLGERELRRAWSGQTDDRGVYRAFGLSPGESLVVATMRPVVGMNGATADFREIAPGEVDRALQLAQPGSAPASAASGPGAAPHAPAPTMNYAPVFYPGTPDLASAVPIALAAGEEHADVDIALQLISTAKISGTVTVPQGVRPETVRLGLASGGPVLPLGINPVFSGGISAGKDGAFTFTGVAPGHYTITAQASSLPPGAAPPMPPGDNGVQRFYAQADVTVAGQDAIVPLTLQPAMTLSGRVAFEDGPPPTASSGFRIMLLPPNSNGQLLSPTMNAAGDRFDFFGILPGRYRVTYSTPPGNTWFLKSAIAHGQETLDGPLEIRPGDDISDWVVTLTNRPSELAGTLTDASGRAAPDYFIIVFPTDKQYWTAGPRRVRQLRPGMDGKFSVQGLPAGEYFIAALTDVEPNEFYAPSFLEPLVSSAAKVTITDGQKTVQDLRISGHR